MFDMLQPAAGMSPKEFEGWKEFAAGNSKAEDSNSDEDAQGHLAPSMSDLSVAQDEFTNANREYVITKNEYTHAGWLGKLLLKRKLGACEMDALGKKQKVERLTSLAVPNQRSSEY